MPLLVFILFREVLIQTDFVLFKLIPVADVLKRAQSWFKALNKLVSILKTIVYSTHKYTLLLLLSRLSEQQHTLLWGKPELLNFTMWLLLSRWGSNLRAAIMRVEIINLVQVGQYMILNMNTQCTQKLPNLQQCFINRGLKVFYYICILYLLTL